MTTNTLSPADIRFALWVAQAMKANKPTWDKLTPEQRAAYESEIVRLTKELEKGQANDEQSNTN